MIVFQGQFYTKPYMTEEERQNLLNQIVERHGLNDPYPVQYTRWVTCLITGDWGWSPTLQDDVLTALVRRTPATAELTLYSLLILIPMGLVSGSIAGANQNRLADHHFRIQAFIGTSMPTFILALILLSIFYVAVKWFPPERLSITNNLFVKSASYHTYTGLLTIDGFLNQRPDISLDAARHLVVPVFTLSLMHWATLGRVTRAAMIEELQTDYVIAGKARGLPNRSVIWRHAFRNVLAPALTSSILSAASLLTGAFVVEIMFNLNGVSEVGVLSTIGVPDAPAIMGFAVYSVVVVLLLMLILDIVQAVVDPRVRQGIISP